MRQPGVAASLIALAAIAGPRTTPAADAPVATSPSLDFSIGAFGIFDHVGDPTRVGIEYRFRALGGWAIVPAAGIAFGPDSVSYFYLGVQHDFHVGAGWFVTPSFAAGVFDNGHELGAENPVEFQTGLTITHAFPRGCRLGVAMYHISNGGLSIPNAGTEAAVLMFGIPLGRRGPATPQASEGQAGSGESSSSSVAGD